MDKSRLIADRVTGRTAEVPIDGVGTVTVRALSRWEMIQAGKYPDNLQQERYILSCAMLDPKMGEDDVAAWQKASPPGEINEVASVVNQLSGIAQESPKSGVQGVPEQS